MTDATDRDRENEQRVASRLAEVWRCEMKRLAGLDPVDYYAVRDDRVFAVCEVKCRNVTHTTYPTVYLSLRKWLSLMASAAHFTVRGLWIVQWTDALGYLDCEKVGGDLVWRGRKDRGKANDQEPCCEVPIALFTMVGEDAPVKDAAVEVSDEENESYWPDNS